VSVALLLAAAAAAQSPTICADRPSKATGTCTVPALHWQLETAAVDWSRITNVGSSTTVTSIGSSTVKLGLSDSADIEASFSPYIQENGDGAHVSGFGDIFVRYKQRLTQSAARVQAAIMPFIKLPTARGALGNGRFEGGLVLPIGTAVGPISVTLGPEIDVLADSERGARHLAITNVINLSAAAAPRLTISAELWNSEDLDPARTRHLWSADAAAAYLANRRIQLDGGANFGLDRATPAIELYVGASVLF